jgi:hypothetical protein
MPRKRFSKLVASIWGLRPRTLVTMSAMSISNPIGVLLSSAVKARGGMPPPAEPVPINRTPLSWSLAGNSAAMASFFVEVMLLCAADRS